MSLYPTIEVTISNTEKSIAWFIIEGWVVPSMHIFQQLTLKLNPNKTLT